MTALLLDTHAWVWLAGGDRRLAKHESRLNRAAAGGQLLLSAISVYEAALIGMETDSGSRRGKQAVVMKPTVRRWILDAQEATRVVFPLDAAHALEAGSAGMLQAMHPDPFDRFIVAAALSAKAHLVTADAKIIGFAEQVGLPLLAV